MGWAWHLGLLLLVLLLLAVLLPSLILLPWIHLLRSAWEASAWHHAHRRREPRHAHLLHHHGSLGTHLAHLSTGSGHHLHLLLVVGIHHCQLVLVHGHLLMHLWHEHLLCHESRRLHSMLLLRAATLVATAVSLVIVALHFRSPN